MSASRICCVGTWRRFSHFLRPFQWPNWMSSVSMAPKSVSKLKPRISSLSTPISLRQSLNSPTQSPKVPILSVETAMKSVAPNTAYFVRCSECEPNRLQLCVMLDGVGAQLASEAGLLVAAEGHGRVHGTISIDPDGARLQPARECVRLLDIIRPDAGGET